MSASVCFIEADIVVLCLVILRVFLKYFSGVGWLQKIKLKSVKSNGKMTNMFSAMKTVADKKMTIMLLLPSSQYLVRHWMIASRVVYSMEVHQGWTLFLQLRRKQGWSRYLLHIAGCGFPLTRTMVKAFAWAIAKRSGRSNRFHPEYAPGNHWWSLFKQHHPSLALCKSDNLERSRAEALNPATVSEYFDLLRTTLEKMVF